MSNAEMVKAILAECDNLKEVDIAYIFETIAEIDETFPIGAAYECAEQVMNVFFNNK